MASLVEIDAFVEEALVDGIIKGYLLPKAVEYAEGRKAREEDKGFHECPYPQHTAKALSWRFGWNDRALELNE